MVSQPEPWDGLGGWSPYLPPSSQRLSPEEGRNLHSSQLQTSLSLPCQSASCPALKNVCPGPLRELLTALASHKGPKSPAERPRPLCTWLSASSPQLLRTLSSTNTMLQRGTTCREMALGSAPGL